MYELIKVKGNTYYIDCPSKIGIYVTPENEAYIIDSGNNREAGKKILRILTENMWKPKAIINTHANADHIGGNRLIENRADIPVYAAGANCLFTKKTMLEPSFLYGGYPCLALQNKFLMAEPSKCLDISLAKLPENFEYFFLPGHYFDMIGIRTPDNVCFVADTLFSEKIISKYHIFYIYDVAAYMDTLRKLPALMADFYVPAHAEATNDILGLCELNIDKVREIIGNIAQICGNGKEFDDILKEVFDKYSLEMDFDQYVLVGSTIKSYLSYMADSGIVKYRFIDNRLIWSKA